MFEDLRMVRTVSRIQHTGLFCSQTSYVRAFFIAALLVGAHLAVLSPCAKAAPPESKGSSESSASHLSVSEHTEEGASDAARETSFDPALDHGPHAGFMRGKGSVQAELLLGPGSGFRLYFVDENWTDIDITDATIVVLVQRNSGTLQPVRCAPKPSSDRPELYICELPKDSTLSMGEQLFVKFNAKDGTTQSFNYTFPFAAHEEDLPFPEMKPEPSSTAATPKTS